MKRMEQGLNRQQSFLYGGLQGIATGLLSRISPDEKFLGDISL